MVLQKKSVSLSETLLIILLGAPWYINTMQSLFNIVYQCIVNQNESIYSNGSIVFITKESHVSANSGS